MDIQKQMKTYEQVWAEIREKLKHKKQTGIWREAKVDKMAIWKIVHNDGKLRGGPLRRIAKVVDVDVPDWESEWIEIFRNSNIFASTLAKQSGISYEYILDALKGKLTISAYLSSILIETMEGMR
jgi:hypothetical protein